MKKKENLKSILKGINKYNDIIKESYVFNNENSNDMLLDDNYNEYNDDDDIKVDASKTAEDRINDIRAIALEGIQEFAEDVESDEYNIFKNIWMSCDKFYISKNKDSEELK